MLKGGDFILIDDVVTTDSTVKEACKILKNKGAGTVYTISRARD